MKLLSLLTFISTSALCQNHISCAIPIIRYEVEAIDNWGPDQKKLTGSAISYGVVMKYSIQPSVILGSRKLSVVVGGGYNNLVFRLRRPFDFESLVQPVFYTKRYAYNNLTGILGLKYRWLSTKKYEMETEIAYSWLLTFRQTYTPTRRHVSSDPHKQINRDFMKYGGQATATLGVRKSVKTRLMVGFDLVIPFYTRWRMDEIFDDDSTEFFSAKYGFGANINVVYRLNKSQPAEP